MAKYWGLNPDVVERWSIIKFMDREEFAMVQLHMSRPKPDNEPGARPGFKPWKGPYVE
jgi:hypothetical protein